MIDRPIGWAAVLALSVAATACGGGSRTGSDAGASSGGSSSSGGGSSTSSSSSGGGSSTSSSSGGGGSSSGAAAVLRPTAHAQFDYQIGGAYTPAAAVGIVDRDGSDAPVAGKYNVCYVNAFQTQPDAQPADATEPYTAAWWKKNHADLLLEKGSSYVVDEEWGEIVLDVSTAAKRTAILSVIGQQIDACAAHGFQAIEPDNLNSWERSQGLFTMAADVEMAKLLAARAHADGLAIAQKNTSEMAPRRAEIGFDFAIVEECQPWGDCAEFSDAYGSLWFEIEYSDYGKDGGMANFQAACAARGTKVSVILRDRDVVPAGSSAYVYRTCSP